MARPLRSFGNGSSSVANGALERDGTRDGVGATDGSTRLVRATDAGLGDGVALATTAGVGVATGDGPDREVGDAAAERDGWVVDGAGAGRALVGAGVGRGAGVGLGDGGGAPLIVIVPLIAACTEQTYG